jgi:hypothetical protein
MANNGFLTTEELLSQFDQPQADTDYAGQATQHWLDLQRSRLVRQ